MDSVVCKTCRKCLRMYTGRKCQPCANALQRKWAAAHPEKVKAMARAAYEKSREARIRYAAQWKRENPEKTKASTAKYRATHAQELLVRSRAYRTEHCEQLRQDARKRRAEQREVVSYRNARWYAENPGKFTARTNAWKRANPEKVAVLRDIYRLRKVQAVPGWFSELDLFVAQEAVLLRGVRQQLTGVKWHVDHVVPLRGRNVCGLHVYSNLAVVPATANLKKHNRWVA